MQETFRVYDAKNREIASRELEHELGPILIVADGSAIRFAETASASDEVLAALVRDEDGWTLAAANPSLPIMSGSKAMQDIHLLVGLPCKIGDCIIRIDREVADAGYSLVWRYSGSPIAVDHVVGGRNGVTLSGENSFPQVNSAVGGQHLFDFYQTAEGFEISTGENASDRLSVSDRTLFAVGGFEGMFLTTGDAAQAIKTSDPFAWPSRGIRRALELSCFALLALLATALVCQKLLVSQRQTNAQYRGAVEIASAGTPPGDNAKDDVLVYNLTFFRTLPSVLTARPNAPTLDLIQRGSLLASDPGVAAKVKFLKQVRTIQETILSGRWEELRKTIASVDAATFVECDADEFLFDAKEVAESLTERLPQTLTEASAPGNEKGVRMLMDDNFNNFHNLSDNLFMVGDVIRREYNTWQARIAALRKYVVARDRVMAEAEKSGEKIAQSMLYELYYASADMIGTIDNDTAGFADFNRREYKLLKGIVDGLSAKVVAKSEAGEPGLCTVLLNPLADIAELIEYPPETVAGWRNLARTAAKRLDNRCRKLYSSYRIAAMNDKAGAEKILDEILAIGDANNSFRKWAEKEKKRLSKTEKGVGK